MRLPERAKILSLHKRIRECRLMLNVVNLATSNTVYREILATVLIWRFGDLEANRQIKKSPIINGWPARSTVSARGKQVHL